MDMKGVFGGLLACLALCCGQCVAKETLHQDIARIIEGKRARVGVAVIIDGKDTVTVNNGERYPMMSGQSQPASATLRNIFEKALGRCLEI